MSTTGKNTIFLFCAWLTWAGGVSPSYGISLGKSPERQTMATNKQVAARAITGKITSSADGSALPGVNVVVKGTSLGTTSAVDGSYTINVENNSDVLVFSFIGYVTQETAVGARSTIDIALAESSEQLSEVVVTALGIKREKRSLGYSVGEVGGKDIINVPQENLTNALAGRVAGVTINQTSGAGSSVSVIIRGATSLSNDNQPLFVIDGVPIVSGMGNISSRMGDRNNVDYGNAITDINPDDVESISVLKGPSAAALYGSRAGNGVVLITTKKGVKGKGMGVSFSTSNVFETPYRFLDLHYDYASGNRTSALNEASEYWAGPPLDKGVLAQQWNSPLDANGVKIPTELRSYRDNMKNFLQTGITSTNNVAISGSNDKGTYRLSYNLMKNRGVIPNSDLNRNSISLATSYDLKKNVKVSSNLNFVRSNADNRPSTANRGANPLEAVYIYSHVNVLDLKDYWLPGQEGIAQKRVSTIGDNPYFLAHAINNGFKRDRAFGNVRLDWEIDANWSFMARGMHDMSLEERETKIPFSYSRAAKGGYFLENLKSNESNADFLLSYKNTLGDFDLNVSGGGNYMYRNYTNTYIGSGGGGLTIPNIYRVSNIDRTGEGGANLNVSNWYDQKGIYSLFGMASLGYKNMLYLNATARNDWSSTLPIENRSYFYPAVDGSWLVNYTFDLPQQISLFKVRAGWAKSGNDTGPYQLSPVLGTNAWGSLLGVNLPAGLLNPQLLPEIQTSTEFGLDINLFQNRLRFEGTYYHVENKNQIFDVTTAASSGFNSKKINAGLLASRGFEINLGGTILSDRNGWSWDVNTNLTRNRTKIVSLADGMDFFTLWDDNGGGAFTWVGEDIGNIYSRGYAHVKDASSPYYKWPIINASNWIQDNDRTARMKVGNFNPKFIIGAQTTVSYKRFSLSASFDWRVGGQFQSYSYRYGGSNWKSGIQNKNLIPYGGQSEAELIAMLKANPEKYIYPQNGNFPRVGGYTEETGGVPFDSNNDGVLEYDGAFIPGVILNADGSYTENLGGPGTIVRPISNMFPWNWNQQITFDSDYLKLRELSIAYRIPAIAGFSNASISVFTRNIMVWNAAKIGIDPERAFTVDGGRFRQGMELQNVMPWTMPIGFKLNFDF